jgi:hypothetical protein
MLQSKQHNLLLTRLKWQLQQMVQQLQLRLMLLLLQFLLLHLTKTVIVSKDYQSPTNRSWAFFLSLEFLLDLPVHTARAQIMNESLIRSILWDHLFLTTVDFSAIPNVFGFA